MNKTVQAKINWVPQEDGGRKVILPAGMRYCPIIVFESEKTAQTLWSAAIFNTLVEGRNTVSDVSYLSEEAPHYLLQSGSKFRLFEGQQVVANGVVV